MCARSGKTKPRRVSGDGHDRIRTSCWGVRDRISRGLSLDEEEIRSDVPFPVRDSGSGDVRNEGDVELSHSDRDLGYRGNPVHAHRSHQQLGESHWAPSAFPLCGQPKGRRPRRSQPSVHDVQADIAGGGVGEPLGQRAEHVESE